MKIVALSDIHGSLLEDNIELCDVVCICGDIVPLDIQRNILKSISWFLLDFKPWAESLPCHKVIFIAGNHDFFLDELGPKRFNSANKVLNNLLGEHKKDSKLVYLCDSSYDYKGIRFYGTPWCPNLKNWAFYKTSEELTDIFKNIPNKCDVLLTHCPPKIGLYGTVLQNDIFNFKEDYGCIELANAIKQKSIKNWLCGHIHSGLHMLSSNDDNIDIMNVSIKDENYQDTYIPYIFEI